MRIRECHRLGRLELGGWACAVGWVVAAGGIGWLTGHLLHRTSRTTEAAATESRVAVSPAVAVVAFEKPAWGVRDGLSVAALRETSAGVKRTAETALWLARASATEISEWWPSLAAEKPQDHGLLDLVMVRWVELDPLSALARVTGTSEEFRAWWAWGKVDPALAIKQAKAFKCGHIWRVIQGAGAGDPLVAIRLAEEHPEFAYPAVEDAIKEGLKNLGWRESLDYQFSDSTLQSWARYEPDRAFQWALEHAPKVDAGTWTVLVEQLNESDPSQVSQALAKLPAGITRQNLLLAQLTWTASRNLDDALLMAAAAESPTLRNRMLLAIGSNLTSTDPTRSLAMFREVMENGGDDTARRVIRPDGSSSSQSGDSPLESWLDALMGQEPAEAMAITRAAGDSDLENRARTNWLARDFSGYSAALREMPEGDMRDRELAGVAQFLTASANARATADDFSDALEWASAITNPALRSERARSVIETWVRRDEASAAAYFGEEGKAAADLRATYQEMKGGNP